MKQRYLEQKYFFSTPTWHLSISEDFPSVSTIEVILSLFYRWLELCLNAVLSQNYINVTTFFSLTYIIRIEKLISH